MTRFDTIAKLALLGVVALGLVGLVGVADAAKKADGMDLYKEYCKPCHTDGSEAGEVTPMTLIQDQWVRFFDEEYVEEHAEVLDPHHGDEPVVDVISDEDLEADREFAIDHAADSEHPMTCG